jgi:hypothetical protein
MLNRERLLLYHKSKNDLLSPEGRRLFGICQIPGYIQNVTQMQFFQQHKHKVVILLIPGRNYGEQDKQTLLKKSVNVHQHPICARSDRRA